MCPMRIQKIPNLNPLNNFGYEFCRNAQGRSIILDKITEKIKPNPLTYRLFLSTVLVCSI